MDKELAKLNNIDKKVKKELPIIKKALNQERESIKRIKNRLLKKIEILDDLIKQDDCENASKISNLIKKEIENI